MEAIVSSDSRRRLMGPRRTVRGGLLDHAYTGHGSIMAASNHEQRRHRRRARDSFSREAITNSTIAAPSLAVDSNHAVVRGGMIAFVEKESSVDSARGRSFHANAIARPRWRCRSLCSSRRTPATLAERPGDQAQQAPRARVRRGRHLDRSGSQQSVRLQRSSKRSLLLVGGSGTAGAEEVGFCFSADGATSVSSD